MRSPVGSLTNCATKEPTASSDGPDARAPGETNMKAAAKHYITYGLLTTAIWIALDTLGLLPHNPHSSWLRELTTIWLSGIVAVAVQKLLFNNPLQLIPPTLPRPQPNHSRRSTLLILAIFILFMLGVLFLEAARS